MKRVLRSPKAWCWAFLATILVGLIPSLARPQDGHIRRWLHKLRPHTSRPTQEAVIAPYAASADVYGERPVVLAQDVQQPGEIQPPPSEQPPDLQPPPSEQPQPPPSDQPQPPPGQTQTAMLQAPDRSTLFQQLEQRRASLESRPTEAVTGGEAPVRAATDVGDFVGKSPALVSLKTQKRTPVSSDPRLRGYHVGQLVTQADGAYWFPARQDMDTMLSKLDSSIISNLIVLNGPYSARYGPGFSFIDIATADTPRYQNGFEWGGRTFMNYQTNGEQWYGRETVWGGSSDWGFRVGYGLRSGSDYESGNGTDMPSSYKMRDLDSAFGLDLSPDSRIKFGYLRLDQTDTEFPGQVYDVDFLVTDAFNLQYELENQHRFDLLTVNTWYNRTRFEGNAQRWGKRNQIPELNSPNRMGGVLNFTGFTDVDEMSTGFSSAVTWGLPEEPQLTLGVDLRYVEQELNEYDAADSASGVMGPLGPSGSALFLGNLGIPRSHSSNPGLFLEHLLPLGDRLTVTSGLRADWVSTDIEGRTRGYTDAELHTIYGSGFDQNFGLWSGFVTAEYALSDTWSVLGAAGHAERAPTLTELYALNSFLAILQQGFTQVRGNTGLHSERLWQLDLGLRTNSSRFRGGINGFYAWVIDYITYEAINDALNRPPRVVEDGLVVQFVNTDLATLSGAEMYGEFDLTCYLTPFATLSYVEGRDHSRDARGIIPGSDEEPLPGIAPLETRLGIRLHEPVYEPDQNPGWGLELAARVVDDQDRVASSLLERQSGGFTVWDIRGYLQARENLMLVAGIENIGDNNYHEHLDLRTGNGVLRPGINFYIGGELTY